MTGRQNVEAAFSASGAAQIPCVLCYEDIFVRDHWNEIVPYPWWYQFSPDIEHQLLWRRRVIEALGQDWFYLPDFYSIEERQRLSLEIRPEGVYRIDALLNTEERLAKPQIGGWSITKEVESLHPDTLAQTPEEIDRCIGLSGKDDLGSGKPEGKGDLARRLLIEYGDRAFPIRHVLSPLWNCYDLWGFEGLMTMIASRPDLVRYACQRYLERAQSSIEYSASLGAAGIWIEDCLTDMISPAAFKQMNLPYVQMLADKIRSLGLNSVYYFCGNPAGKWDLILASEADAISLEEGKKGFTLDIETIVKNIHGRKTVLGNLDAINLLSQGDEMALRAEVKRQIQAGRQNGGRFMMGIGSPVTPGTSLARVQLLVNLVKELGGCD